MNSNLLKNIISWLIILLGAGCYIFFAFDNNMVIGIIALLIAITAWTVISFIIENFSIGSFSYLLFFYGIIIALSLFFSMAIEQVPYPKGAIIFKPVGIAISFGVFFVSAIPILFHSQIKSIEQYLESARQQGYINEPNIVLEDDEWEEASEAEINSGQYETA
tara:strand:- start:245 stop:733 length:489 start_codon:yes stop_codon:yes gene_type:complete